MFTVFTVYILQSEKDNKTYVGYSENLEKRLEEHNKGKVTATRHRRPFIVLFTEQCNSEEKAKQREKYWKNGSGRRKLKKYFAHGFPPI